MTQVANFWPFGREILARKVSTGGGRWRFDGTFGRLALFVTIVEILQALSSELVLDRLVERLSTLALEHAGADRALLLLGTADAYRIEAEASMSAGGMTVSLGASLESRADLPTSIVLHVLRTRETVAVDALDSNPFSGDEYFARQRPRAIYCLPLVKGERLVGVLYLESALIPATFTPERVTLIQVLASQGAISLENARLYAELLEHHQRAEAVEVLRIANERLELALRGSKVGMWDFDLTSTGGSIRNAPVTWVNLWEALGYEPELPGPVAQSPRFHPERWHPDDRGPILAALEAYLSGEAKEFGREWRLLHRDGSIQWRLSRGVAIRDATGKPTRFIGTSVDITDRKVLEEQLLQAKEAAIAASKAKDDFLANVSHEIRTPMNAILGMTEMVLETPLAEEQGRALAAVKSAADGLLLIIEDLLDFSKIEAGRVDLSKDPLSLRAHLTETLRPFVLSAKRKGLKLAEEVSADVPDGLLADAGRLRQVLVNLVGNAVKFTARGEVSLRVEVVGEGQAASPESAHLRFVVRDTGIGIPLDKQAVIFDAFAQQDMSTTRQYGGTGLGLTIAARLAKLMGGEILVTSEPGRGSTFTFTAPFATRSGDAPLVPSRPSLRPPVRLGALRVLVAEDNEVNADLLRRLLEKRGHEAYLTMRGDDALEAAEAGTFDLLLLDLHMPGADGFEVIRRIRERERVTGGHLPTIALTARSRAEDRDRCLAAGMDEFLAKPIHANALWVAIEQVTSGPRQRASPEMGSKLESIDARVLLAACGSDDGILKKLGGVMRGQLPAELAVAERALRGQDATALAQAAHKLQGMVAVASTSTADLASELEVHAEGGRLDEARVVLERLELAVRQVLEEIDGISVFGLQLKLQPGRASRW